MPYGHTYVTNRAAIPMAPLDIGRAKIDQHVILYPNKLSRIKQISADFQSTNEYSLKLPA